MPQALQSDLSELPRTPNPSSDDDTALARYHRINYDLFNQCEATRADARDEYIQAQATLDAAVLDPGANRLSLPPLPDALSYAITRPTFIPEPDDVQFATSVREYRAAAVECYQLILAARTEIATLRSTHR